MHALIFVRVVIIRNCINGLRILSKVLFDDLHALFRVLPVLSHMSGSSRMLIVIKIIKNCASGSLLRNEPYKIWYVDFLCKVFDIETNINHLPFIFVWAVEGYQEAACQFVDNTSLKVQHTLDFYVSMVSPGLS